MLFEWALINIETRRKIQTGDVEAEDPTDATRVLNEKMNVHPHTGEMLEIIEPHEKEGYTHDTILI
jgi:hypothetical protein